MDSRGSVIAFIGLDLERPSQDQCDGKPEYGQYDNGKVACATWMISQPAIM